MPTVLIIKEKIKSIKLLKVKIFIIILLNLLSSVYGSVYAQIIGHDELFLPDKGVQFQSETHGEEKIIQKVIYPGLPFVTIAETVNVTSGRTTHKTITQWFKPKDPENTPFSDYLAVVTDYDYHPNGKIKRKSMVVGNTEGGCLIKCDAIYEFSKRGRIIAKQKYPDCLGNTP